MFIRSGHNASHSEVAMRSNGSRPLRSPYRECPEPIERETTGDVSFPIVAAILVLLVVLVRVLSVEPAPGESFGRLGNAHLLGIGHPR
jgi:hypothetical protein